MAQVIDTQGVECSISIEPLRTLGKGRAATAELVEVEGLHSQKLLCVEKIFRPGLLTRFIYWCFFQSPFAYRYSKDAILACLYRRKVAGRIIVSSGIDIDIARPYYVRWDERARAYVLGTEFIKGTSLRVEKVDERVLRRFLHNYVAGSFIRLFGGSYSKEKKEKSETSELLDRMKVTEKLLRKSGLTGSGWQVSRFALVSTANFIRRGERFVLVDIESGIPSVLVPYYLFKSMFTGRFPFFDDVEGKKLSGFVKAKEKLLREKFGDEGYEECSKDAELLIEHTKRWKDGEVAVIRNNWKLLLPSVRAAIKRARMEAWLKEGILDRAGMERFASSKRFFTSSIFLLGILPSKLGRVARKLVGNDTFRAKFKRFLKDKEFRKEALGIYASQHTGRWQESGRITLERKFERLSGKFILHLFLSRLTPAALHRFISDGARRKKVATTALFFVVSERFQTEYAKYVVFKRMREWVVDGRLSPDEARMMKARVEDGSIQEYVRVFGIHVALKFLEALTSGIKIVGIAWFLKIFVEQYPELNPHGEMTFGLLKAFALTFLHNPIPVLMMINTSVWRTLITLWRMLSIKRRHISYKVALGVGLIPAFGSLAYPMQMYWRCKELSLFLIRDILAVFAQKVPIYGGKHTLTEVWFVRAADMPAELMDLMKISISSVKKVLPRRKPALDVSEVQQASPYPQATSLASTSNPSAYPSEAPRGEPKKPGRFDKIVDEMVSGIWERYEKEYAGGDF